MSRRSYEQYCGIAVALDVVGERWSLLLLRNLAAGPQRFTDLHQGLPGIGTGLLSERLRHLEDAGVIRRTTLPPPAASAVYELTADGEQLRPVLVGLARWGLARLGPPDDRYADADTLALALEARFEPAASEGADGTYQVTVDDRPLHVEVRDGAIRVHAGPAPSPVASLRTDLATALALNSGATTLAAALASGAVTLSGDADAALALAGALGLAA